jgi:hypothetical protein
MVHTKPVYVIQPALLPRENPEEMARGRVVLSFLLDMVCNRQERSNPYMGFAPSVFENEQERKERPPPVAAATLEPRGLHLPKTITEGACRRELMGRTFLVLQLGRPQYTSPRKERPWFLSKSVSGKVYPLPST